MSPPPLKKRKTTLHKTFKNELNRLEEKISQSHELMMSDFKKNVNDLKSTIKRNLSENVEDIKQNNYNFGNYERRVKACSEILQQSNSITLYEMKSNIKDEIRTPKENHSNRQLEISNLKQKNENYLKQIFESESTVKVLTNFGCGPS